MVQQTVVEDEERVRIASTRHLAMYCKCTFGSLVLNVCNFPALWARTHERLDHGGDSACTNQERWTFTLIYRAGQQRKTI